MESCAVDKLLKYPNRVRRSSHVSSHVSVSTHLQYSTLVLFLRFYTCKHRYEEICPLLIHRITFPPLQPPKSFFFSNKASLSSSLTSFLFYSCHSHSLFVMFLFKNYLSPTIILYTRCTACTHHNVHIQICNTVERHLLLVPRFFFFVYLLL